jgi:Xaa-Pro aminopeptidase
VVLAVGNCGLYTGPWGVRVEDTVVVGTEGPVLLTEYPRALEVQAASIEAHRDAADGRSAA